MFQDALTQIIAQLEQAKTQDLLQDFGLGFAKQYLPRIRAQIYVRLGRSEGAQPQASQGRR